MMKVDESGIKKELEEIYDIPFSVKKINESGEAALLIGPAHTGEDLFQIKMTYRNEVRLIMDFMPEKYSADFIRTMALKGKEEKSVFMRYAHMMTAKGANCLVRINGKELEMEEGSAWPEEWKECSIRVTCIPDAEGAGFDCSKELKMWANLMMGLILSLADIVPVDSEEAGAGYTEGNKTRVEENRYERNILNRNLCLQEKGYSCLVCGMNFEQTYGPEGHHFIHVHHLIPVSQLGGACVIDPVKDLVPVCPNCHAMLHRRNPPYTPEELKEFMERII